MVIDSKATVSSEMYTIVHKLYNTCLYNGRGDKLYNTSVVGTELLQTYVTFPWCLIVQDI